jgi:translation initiation factor IF-2
LDPQYNNTEFNRELEYTNEDYLGKHIATPAIRPEDIGRTQAAQLDQGFILNTSVIIGAPRRVGDALILRSYSSLHVHYLTRCFHIASAVQAKRNFQESGFMKTPRKPKREKKEKRTQAPVEAPYVPPKPKKIMRSSPGKFIDIFDGMTLAELAKRTGEGIDTLQDILSNIGEQVSLEFQPITMDVAELIAMELGIDVKRVHLEKGAKVETRPAVVTVMGHVDHGKTSLLDSLRQTSVAAKEAGGITQHLGAFVVSMSSGASLTFLDTPGHAAFSAMRARGAAVTDIVVLVVAADDGVMPQTREAMAHAQAANVPIVVSINKCDKANADPQKVRIQLCAEGLALEEMGGDIQVVEISATKNIGLDKLEEALLLQAEIMDLKARIDGDAHAYVVEARVDRGHGPLATAIVRSGTLVPGLHIVVGAEWGRIRVLRDMSGRPVPSVGPSMPVEIEGLRGLPLAGDEIMVVSSEERARKLSNGRKIRLEQERLRKQSEEKIVMPDDVDEKVEMVEMTLIVKADVQGTVQAVTDTLKSLNSSQVLVNIVHTGVGAISQADVDLAQACGAIIVGFNIRNMPSSVDAAARQAKINIRLHRVIYHLLEDIGNLIVSMAPGICETQVAGEAQILNIFELKGRSKAKGDDAKIAGCRVVDGRITKTARLRVLRSGEMVFEGNCQSLKREKQDVEAVGKGNECGLIIQEYDGFQIGDVIQCLELVNRKPKFVSSESGAVRIEC